VAPCAPARTATAANTIVVVQGANLDQDT